jgi:hypothetical protein
MRGGGFSDEHKRAKQNESAIVRRKNETKVKYQQTLLGNKTSSTSASVLDSQLRFLF